MSGGANKRREVLKFEGDDIDEYMDGRVNGVTHNESEWRMERHDATMLVYISAHPVRQSVMAPSTSQP